MTSSAPVQTDSEDKVVENSIPKSRVDVMIAKATAEASAKAAAAEARANTLEAERQRDLATRSQAQVTPPPATPERVLSREEMQSGVDAGTITQAQMDAELEHQLEQRVEKKVEGKQDLKNRGDKLNAEVDQYLERVPDLKDTTSDNSRRFNVECAELLKRGFPNDVSTQLTALRTVLGPLDKVKIPDTSHADREVDTTTHGGAGDDEGGEPEPAGAGPLKGLKPDHVEYYTEGIKDGRYSGWDDPHLQKIMKREVDRK